MHGGALTPSAVVRECVDESVIEAFRREGRDENFLFSYLANAVLSYIEEREQELILDMEYEAWVRIDPGAALKKIEEFVGVFFRAHGVTWSERVFKKGRDLETLAKILLYLYERGIYRDGVSRYLMLRGFKGGDALSFIHRGLEKGRLEVRSRFIEIALYLARVRQRFPETALFASKPLTNRIFAFAEPRKLPVGKVEINDELLEKIDIRLRQLYTTFLRMLGCSTPVDGHEELLQRLTREFFREFKEWYSSRGVIFKFYQFQARGIIAILEEIEKALRGGERRAVVLEAPTGAGKTEVFALSSILAILTYKLAAIAAGKAYSGSPLVIVTYPRRALATDQVKRITMYVYMFNKALEKLDGGGGVDKLRISISMNYAEVRYVRELLERLRSEVSRLSPRPKEVRLPYTRVIACREGDQVTVKLPYVQAPEGSGWLEVRLPVDVIEHKDSRRAKNYLRQLWWNGKQIDFIRAFKELVYEEPGDIHITLFESLRRDLLLSKAKSLFGTELSMGPLLFILDEIHLNVGVQGARNAFLLDRIIARVYEQTRQRRGVLFVGLSATIPHARDFSAKLFGLRDERQSTIISIEDSETIPVGGEYFYIIVPMPGVNLLAVSIQSIMVLHFNMPAYVRDNKPLKKTFAFADNLDVVARLHFDLNDALRIGRRAHPPGDYGLQDLRNPYNEVFQLTTLVDLRDNAGRVGSAIREISGLEELQCWLEGELWWPYALEYDSGWRLLEIARYTGREKPEIMGRHIVVTDSALEVGVDYDDVVVIYQHGMPPTIAALIQRAGRSGRIMRDNPLMRAAIAVMLSPNIPTQVAMLEMLLRSRSLRDLLNRERLLLATSNVRVLKQAMVEAILDYITLESRDPDSVLFLEDLESFECKDLLRYLINKRDELIRYLASVFRDRELRLLEGGAEKLSCEVLDELKGELFDKCQKR